MAKDGEKALALLADPQFKPDLVITDMNMPKVAGPELLKQFNANGIPVVVFSSSTNPTDKEEVLKLGARECVEKPSDLDEYTEALWKDDLEVDATSDLVLLPTPSKRTDFRPFWVGWRTIAAT
jgi:CheY-like chemotaxis protein